MSSPNPYQTPQRAGVLVPRGKAKWLTPLVAFCLCYYGLAVYQGVRAVFATDPELGDLLVSCAFWICICAWALADARWRGQPIPYSQRIWFYVLAPVVVPGYILGTRGWRGLGYLLFHVAAWFVLSTSVMHLTGLVYHGDAWWHAVGAQ